MKTFKIIILFLLSVQILFQGCSSNDSGNSNCTPTVSATLTNVQTQVLTPSCSNIGCHTTATAAGGLDLSSTANSYAQTVNVPVTNTAAAGRGKIRVIPSDSINSFLIQKMDGTFQPDEGVLMPKSGTFVSCGKIELVRQWINSGALNN